MTFEDTIRGYEGIFYSPVTVIYTRHISHFPTIWQLLLPFGLYNAFQVSWNHVEIILPVAMISIFLLGIE